jgi:hypothetical protein
MGDRVQTGIYEITASEPALGGCSGNGQPRTIKAAHPGAPGLDASNQRRQIVLIRSSVILNH